MMIIIGNPLALSMAYLPRLAAEFGEISIANAVFVLLAVFFRIHLLTKPT